MALLSVKPGTFCCPQESPLLLHSKTWSLFVLLPSDSCSAQLLSVSSSFFINTEVTRANAWRGTGYIHQIKLLNHKNQEGAETLVSPPWHSHARRVWPAPKTGERKNPKGHKEMLCISLGSSVVLKMAPVSFIFSEKNHFICSIYTFPCIFFFRQTVLFFFFSPR